MINNLSFSKFRELQNKGYNLDVIYLLTLVKDKVDVSLLADLEKIKGLVQVLQRKGLITKEGVITLDGQTLLDFIDNPEEDVKLIKTKTDDSFEKFWKSFPPTDTFEYKGKSFAGSRALRINKEGCKLKLTSILNTGEYTIDQITQAIEYDITSKKEASIRENTNKLKYVQNSLTYLSQLAFEPFIELMRTGTKVYEAPQGPRGGTDI